MLDRKKILLVDDEPKIVEVIQCYLEKEQFEAIIASDGKTAIELFHKLNPSLVVLDLMLPDMSGEDICKEIRKFSKVPIIMLTAKIDEASILNGFRIGADDYMTKPFSPRQLSARVVTLLRRSEDAIISPGNTYTFGNGNLIINLEKYEVRKNSTLVNLTQTEFNLIKTMLKYPYKAFTREELVSIVLGGNFNGYDRIIDTHIKNIRQKIETDSKDPRYILTVHGVGYRFGGE